MKPFDLAAAQRGELVIDRDGEVQEFQGILENGDTYCKVIFKDTTGHIEGYSLEGKYSHVASHRDLFMAEPPMHSINGHRFPYPVKKKLNRGQIYYLADPTSTEDFIGGLEWEDDFWDFHSLKIGFIHLNRDAALAHRRALILSSGGKLDDN